ncbi:MAG: leucine-rich repeat domain-containing protein [Treponema sp.]|jgi:hypothetical protein|nr:leucine-rich repeat domain-containing protein [Treponema sp.]
MKRKVSMGMRIGAALLLCLALVVVSSCESGEGAQGPSGKDGLSLLWKGELASAPASPEVNWAYHNTADGNSYIWDGTGWVILAKAGIPGTNGTNGTNGANGVGIVWKGSLAADPAAPELNWAYYNTVDGNCYIWNGSVWEVMVVGEIPTGQTITTKLEFASAAGMASGFATLVAEYNPNDTIIVTVTFGEAFDFDDLSEIVLESGLDPVNGLFTAIGSDNVRVHYDFTGTDWTGTDGEDPVPFYLDDYTTGNLNAARPHRNQILSLTMPASLEAVGDYLFYDLQGLQKVSFAGCGELTTINSYAFAVIAATGTALTDISFDGCTKLEWIGDYAFFYSANLRGSNGTTTLDLSSINVPQLTIRDYAFFRAGVNGGMTSVKFPGGGYFGNNAFVRNMGLQSVWITDGRWSELTWNNFLYLDKPTADSYGYSSLPPLWVRETADGGRGLGTGFVLNFMVPDTITLQRMAKGSDLLTNSEDDGNYFAGQLVPTKDGNDAYRGQSSMALGGVINDSITVGNEPPVQTTASTWPLYSKPEAESRYVIGTMVKGVVTLAAPAVSNLETLTPEKGMAITGDPTEYYLSASDAVAGSGTKAQADLPGDMWMVGTGQYASNTGYFWQPTIANNTGAPVTGAKALVVKDFYYPATINQHKEYSWTVQKIGPGPDMEFDTDGDGVADAYKDDVLWSDWGGYGSDQILEQVKFKAPDNDDVATYAGSVYTSALTLDELFAMPATMWGDIRWASPDVAEWKPNSVNTDEPYGDGFGYVKTTKGSEISILDDQGKATKTFTKYNIVDGDKSIACNKEAVDAGKSDNPQIYLTGTYYYFKCHITRDAVTVVDSSTDWKKASRTGVDTYCIINHVVDNKYYTDQRKVYYVYVSQDVNLLRTGKSGNEYVLDHDKELGVVQTYYELIPDAVKTRYSLGAGAAAWTVNHHSVHLALKAGWNQVEEKTTYPGETAAAAEYRGIKTHRISAGKQGPFSTFSSTNTTDFAVTSGKAYMLVNADGVTGGSNAADDFAEQYYSDAGHEIPVPWVTATAE